MKITNSNYRRFLDKGEIEPINEEQIKTALNNIKGRYRREGRALLIALYFTGARPNEVLQIRGKDIKKEGPHITVQVKGSKRGLSRKIYLPYKNELVKELLQYARSLFSEMLIFHHYKNNYPRRTITKTGKIKTRVETTDKIRYYINKWFKGVVDDSIPPYFLRHSRFSKLAMKGVNTEQIRILKGAKDGKSVAPYIHLSSTEAKKISKHME